MSLKDAMRDQRRWFRFRPAPQPEPRWSRWRRIRKGWVVKEGGGVVIDGRTFDSSYQVQIGGPRVELRPPFRN